MKKFSVGFFRGDDFVYGKKFDFNAEGIKSAAVEMNLWEKSNKSDDVSMETIHTSIVLEDGI